jgi:probable phosphoglycerate mutase
VRTVYVVVHPEAAHHVEGLVGGWHDSQLTPAGARAAVLIAGTLRDMIPAAAEAELYSSDLQRARQVATVVGDRLGVQPLHDRRLREKSYGAAGGRPRAWLDQRFVPPPATWDRMQHDEGIPGAETKLRRPRPRRRSRSASMRPWTRSWKPTVPTRSS